MADDSESRRSTRPNKGVPPMRFPAAEMVTRSRFSDNGSRIASKSAKSSSTVRRQEIQVSATQELLGIRKKVADKETELKLAENRVSSIVRRINHVKDSEPDATTMTRKVNELVGDQLDAEEKVEQLQIELENLKSTTDDEIELINQKKDLDLERVESDEDDISYDSSEERERLARVNKWVAQDTVEKVKTPMQRVFVDATASKIVPYTPTPVPRQRKSYLPARLPANKPMTASYQGSSEEEDDGAEASAQKPETVTASTPKPEDNVSMRELVDALKNLGGSRDSGQVILKTTIDKDLPKFAGDPSDWIQFKTEFERTTVKYKMEDAENMVRLRKAISGDAKTTVKSMMVNVSNVKKVMDALEKRFGRPRVVLDNLAAKAKACCNVTIDKPNTIVDFGLAVQALVANVESYKEEGYLNSIELLDTFRKKLSPDLATKWFEWLASDKSRKENLTGFSEWMSAQLDIAYQRVEVKCEEDSSENRNERRRRRGPGSFNAAAGENDKCTCCGKETHDLDKCWSFKKKSIDDRWKLVKSMKACIGCLRSGHRISDCEKTRECKLDGCSKQHHRLLHAKKRENLQKESNSVEDNDPDITHHEGRTVKLEGNFAVITGCDGPLPIVPVKLMGPAGTVKCHALLDSGASRSLMKSEVAKKLGLNGMPLVYSYRGINGDVVTENKAMQVECDIAATLRGSKTNRLRSAITVEEIKMNPYSMNVGEIKKKWTHLRQVCARNLDKVVPDLIVGNNNPQLILPRKILQGRDGEPVGWRAELGWAISGELATEANGAVNVMCGGSFSNESLHSLIKQSFTFEDFGVKLPTKGKNLDEKRAYEILERTTRKVGDSWETGLLWRDDKIQFPESESAGLKRLEYTERKMKDPMYKTMYTAKIDEYLQKKYLKKLTETEAAKKTKLTYIIPHFGVTNPNKPGKFRLVLDAKAKIHGVSLNDNLLKGPDLIRSLVGVLWRFRRHQIALTGDISDMFHRIKIREEDRDSQRILWRNGNVSKPADHYQMQVMIFGATSSPASAIFVKNKNAANYQDKYPHAAEVIVDDFYVDDCLTGGDTVAEVVQLRNQITEINDAGNFTVCKWLSNSKDVLASIPAEIRADGAKQLECKEELPGERVLGMWWNSEDDAFQFKLGLHKVKEGILSGEIPTKRQMCGLIMSLFDPIGFISHYKVKGLILLQEVWNSGIGWDDEIPVAIYQRWTKWLGQIRQIQEVKVPRCYSKLLPCADNIQLHTLVDASSEAFSAVCYLRISCGQKVDVVLVAAKARVAPLKKTTIPRLELQAALMGMRLANSVLDELKINVNSRWFWSDSTTVLHWLSSRAGKLKEFVANRVGEIQEGSNQTEWHWIPTKMNIADIATRFDSEISFSPTCEWYCGPKFLYEDPSQWNFSKDRKQLQDGVFAAISGEHEVPSIHVTEMKFDAIPNPERFSSFTRLCRATAAVRESALFWLMKVRKNDSCKAPWKAIPVDKRNPVTKIKFTSGISAASIAAAEKELVRLAQGNAFSTELKIIQDGGQLQRKSNLWRLSPVLDNDGILKIDGRIGAANVAEEVKFPIILPPKHRITELLVDLEHNRCAHQGVETVLSNLRQRYWIIDARHAVKRSWQRCQQCRLRKARPVNPKMGSLPNFRLASGQPPFTHAGIDLFGPMEVTVGRHHEKRWGVLICCMVTRAVHLEVVHHLSTDELVMALSRFIDSRGRPTNLYSDNGTNFRGGAKELKQQWSELDFAKVQECGKFQEISWTFNPPAAPHMGGVWERLIQSVKKCLETILHEKYPKDTTLMTALKSIENIINSRPITYVSSDPSDAEALTPNHFLRGFSDAGPSIPNDLDSSDQFLRAQWKRGQVIADQFWKHWTRYHLPKLIRREKWHHPVQPLQVGDLVYLLDDQLPRNCWIKGFISRIFPGEDGQVRVVDVSTRDSKTQKVSVYRRPAAKVCPLGLRMEIKEPDGP